MSDGPTTALTHGACHECLRRSWLLSELSGPLDFRARDRARLEDLLALEDEELLQAVGGRRRGELSVRHHGFRAQWLDRADGVEALCRHHPAFPRALNHVGGVRMVNVLGGAPRLAALFSTPTVAILGASGPSDYGVEVASSLGRGLSASGVTVLSSWRTGTSMAAQTGALESRGATVAVLGCGLGVAAPVRLRSRLSRLVRSGCAISELPCDCSGRRWGQLAGERIVVGMAAVTIVVEATDAVGELWAARQAQALGKVLAAVPGRVTSPLARGVNSLLMDGARLVRDTEDVLELLSSIDASPTHVGTVRDVRPQPLEPRLTALLELVGSGCDTPDSLCRYGIEQADVLPALSELELSGLLRRGRGGRYLPTQRL
jgi:DNA processing protein